MRQLPPGRVARATTGIVIVAISLTGCQLFFTPLPNLALAVQQAGPNLVIANCETSIAGEFRLRLSEIVNNEWDEFFIGESDAGWGHAEMLRADSHPWVSVERSVEAQLRPGYPIDIGLTSDEVSGGASFDVPERGLPEDAWLHPDGTLTKTPCGA